MKNTSLFGLGQSFNPFYLLDRFLNPFSYSSRVKLTDHAIEVYWTKRANQKISSSQQPVLAEMQLYFSCVVKKRVIFEQDKKAFRTIPVNEKLKIAFNTVEAASCEPGEFAMSYPAKRVLDSEAAMKMRPRELRIDYRANEWQGEFTI